MMVWHLIWAMLSPSRGGGSFSKFVHVLRSFSKETGSRSAGKSVLTPEMGGSYSDLPSRSSDFAYFALTFRRPDKIKLLLAGQDVVRSVMLTLSTHWTSGVPEHRYEAGNSCYHIRVPGLRVGSSSTRETALKSKSLCCALLQDLYSSGWRLILSSDLSRFDDICTMFFRKTSATRIGTPSIICLSLSSYDSLQLVNAPRHLWRPLLEAVNSATNGPEATLKTPDNENFEIKLNGMPWENASLSQGVEARKILLSVFTVFDKMGYHFYGTANLKGKADSLFFIYDDRLPSGSYQYCMISLNQNDRLRLINCPSTVIDAVRDSVNAHWTLQDETNLQIAHEFKLKGYPWMANGAETVAARFLMAMILENMASVGWPVLASLDISRRVNDKGVFILRSTGGFPSPPTDSTSYFCISLNETDKIRLIKAPKNVITSLRNVVGMHWSAGICREQEYFGSYEMKLNGNPWNGLEAQDSLAAKCLMCIILSTLEENGFTVTCSADVSAKYQSTQNGPDYPIDVHSWFVCQSRQPRVGPSTTEQPVPEYPSCPPPSYNELYGR